MDNIKIGIQLFSLRKYMHFTFSFNRLCAYLNKIGVKDVQVSGIGKVSVENQKKALDKNDIKVCVTHSSFNRIVNDTDKLIAEHKLLGCDCIGLGCMPLSYRSNADTVRKFIADLTPALDKIHQSGLHFAYHNHNFEYKKIDGDKTIMDILLTETNPETFWFTPDVCWFQIAGKNPVEELERMQGRVKVVHFKDYVAKGLLGFRFTTLGKGLVDLDACYKACQRLDMNYIMYEQDCDFEGSPKKAAEASFKKLGELKAANNR